MKSVVRRKSASLTVSAALLAILAAACGEAGPTAVPDPADQAVAAHESEDPGARCPEAPSSVAAPSARDGRDGCPCAPEAARCPGS